MRFTTRDEPDRSLSEGEYYRAVLLEVKMKEITWTPRDARDPGKTTMLDWIWEIQDPDLADPETGSLRVVRGSCKADLSNNPNNQFRAWAESLVGRPIELGEDIDTDDFVGMVADITIVKVPNKKDSSKPPFDNVSQVMPAVDMEPPF